MALCLLLALPLTPAQAQGEDMIRRGAEMFLRGLMTELEPALKDMRDLAEKMGPGLQDYARRVAPVMRDLMEQVGDLSAYELPEVLPNGDILIRRKPVAKPDEIEL